MSRVLPPVHAQRVGVGIGKSTAARRHVAMRVAELRAVGDKRTAIFALPTIALADEQAELFRAMPGAEGLKVAVWRGRRQPNPNAPGFDNPEIAAEDKVAMCRDLDAVADAQEALADVQTGVCRHRDKDGKIVRQCAYFDVCGYQAQRTSRADVWFVAHEVLFERKPGALGEPAFVVVDESAWQSGLFGIGADRRRVTLPMIDGDAEVPGDPLGSQRLRLMRRLAYDALANLPDGPIPRDAIAATGITSNSASEARALEWARKIEAQIFPGMPSKQRKEAVKAVASNETVTKLSQFWHAIEDLLKPGGPEASGWVATGDANTKDGPVRCVFVKGRKPVAVGFDVPTLILDATLQVEPLRRFWPHVELRADIAAEAQNRRVFQVEDRTFSKSRLRQERPFRDLRATLFRLAREYAPGRVLVAIQKEFEDRLRELGNLPRNLDLAHHNAIAGKDGWRDVVALIVVGRTTPAPQTVESLAEALSGAAVKGIDGWYPEADAVREMADGNHRITQADRHPDPLAEDCRWSIAESEIVQIIGRARACNRTSADPVDIWILTNAPLPEPVDQLISAADLDPSPYDLMAASGGVELENPTDAATAYPELWGTRNAAKKAVEHFRAKRLGSNPYNRFIIGKRHQPRGNGRPGMVRVDYQLAGSGKKPAVAWFDPTLVPDPAAWLSDRLGLPTWVRSVRGVATAPKPPVEPVAVLEPEVDVPEAEVVSVAPEGDGTEAIPMPAAAAALAPMVEPGIAVGVAGPEAAAVAVESVGLVATPPVGATAAGRAGAVVPVAVPLVAAAVDAPRRACPFWPGTACDCRPGFCVRLAVRGGPAIHLTPAQAARSRINDATPVI